MASTRSPVRLALFAFAAFAALPARSALALDDPGMLDPFAEHRSRGNELFSAGRFDEAFKEFLGAYAIRKDRELLFDLGRTARELGRTRGALDYLQRYLVDEPTPPTPRGEAAARMVRELVAEQSRGPAATPSASPSAGDPGSASGPILPPSRVRPSHAPSAAALPAGLTLLPVRVEKHGNGPLMMAGGMIFGLSYATAFGTGAYVAFKESDYTNSSGNKHTAGLVLTLPVVGALFTGFSYHEASWWAPWTLLDGMAQLSGLVMLIAGARDKHDVIVPDVRGVRLTVSPWANGAGAGLAASGTW